MMKKIFLIIQILILAGALSAYSFPSATRDTVNATKPCNMATFVRDVSIPDKGVGKGPVLQPGIKFRKTWEIKNVGSCTWDSRYKWAFDKGHLMEGPLSKSLTRYSVKPGQSLLVSVDLIAPHTPGVYTGYWRLVDPQGKDFGTTLNKSFYVTIQVSEPSLSTNSSMVPVSSNYTNRTVYYPLRDCAPSRLYVGDTVYVSYGGGPNGIRSEPDVHPNNITYRAPEGEMMEILSGPKCSWGWLLWKVKTETGRQGWTPESDGDEFWLIPLDKAPALPSWIKGDKQAYDAYKQARQVIQDRYMTDTQKAEKIRILQRNFGEEVITTVIRYVPVYDTETSGFISFDSYMRRLASQEGHSTSSAPIEQDPVGAGLSIFFDSSVDNIMAQLGLP
jgi:hypothetical protein